MIEESIEWINLFVWGKITRKRQLFWASTKSEFKMKAQLCVCFRSNISYNILFQFVNQFCLKDSPNSLQSFAKQTPIKMSLVLWEVFFLIVLKSLLYLNFSFHQSVPTSKYSTCNVNYFAHYFLGQQLSINGWWLHLLYGTRPCKVDLLFSVKWEKTQCTMGFIFNIKWMCIVFLFTLKYKCCDFAYFN